MILVVSQEMAEQQVAGSVCVRVCGGGGRWSRDENHHFGLMTS